MAPATVLRFQAGSGERQGTRAGRGRIGSEGPLGLEVTAARRNGSARRGRRSRAGSAPGRRRLLRTRVQEEDAPAVVREVAAVKELGIIWQQQYVQQEETVRLRNKDDLLPNAQRHDSPYDPEVRYSTKRDLSWIGYKVHLTETCEPKQVEVITHVETTYAPVADVEQLPTIHEALGGKGVPPGEHLGDTGYMDVSFVL